MRIFKINSKKFCLGLVIIIAASGSLLFFPMKMGGAYTCCYHRLIGPPQAGSGLHASITDQAGPSGDHTDRTSPYDHSELLGKYLHQYAFIWWGSVGVLALGVYFYLKMRKSMQAEDSDLTLK